MINDYEREHNAVLRRLGAECTVLLRSNGAFPLEKPCTLALYGSGARRTIKGGTGSGEVNSRYAVSVEDGLKAAGFTISTEYWLDAYDKLHEEAHKAFIRDLKRQAKEHHTLAILESMGVVMSEPEYEIPMHGEGDTAVYVLSRISGEGSDRKAVPGDILMTETEKRDILLLNERYEKFLLVLNVGGVVDLSPVAEVSNILLLGQLGVETGSILTDILLGKNFPSGKLTTTWSAWEDYPRIGSFGEKDDTRYNEGIYVGYRGFDSLGKRAMFPFGFGLSFTNFELCHKETAISEEIVTVTAEVRNTGAFSGRETAQLYVSVPKGRLDQPYQTLAAFAKSKELAPGESEVLTLSFCLRDIASYDEQRALWILEPGDYVLRLGTSSAQTQTVSVISLDAESVVRICRNCLGKPDFTDWRPEKTLPEEQYDVPVLPVDAGAVRTVRVKYDLPHRIAPITKRLSEKDLALIGIGAFKSGIGSLSVVGNAAQSVAGAAGETTGILKKKGFSPLIMADGPAGLRLSREYTVDKKGVHPLGDMMPESMMELLPDTVAWVMKKMSGSGRVKGEIHEQYCTAIPIGTAIAQSWNPELAECCGDIVGDEMERFGIHLWLAPALNIHRDIRCGRNFEYFSEDPLISGKFAAAITRGVQKHPGCGTTIKHFAANNQETNRYNANSAVSERAMREIYLRGFEIAVKESQPHALMTSYNLLNGVHTSERRDLLEDILRAEFGFKGLVMTDWIIGMMSGKDNKYRGPVSSRIAAAGNDVTMPGGPADLKAMLRGIKDGTVSRKQLEINATRVLRIARKLVEKRG